MDKASEMRSIRERKRERENVEGKIRGEKSRGCIGPGARTVSDKGEEQKREWNTTSTVATRKFDFQIGVARANGPGSESYVGSLCAASVSVY